MGLPLLELRTRQSLLKRLLVSTVLAIGGLLATAFSRQFLASAQVQSADFLFPSWSDKPSQTTVIVGIDQRSYRELLPVYGPLVNWSRTVPRLIPILMVDFSSVVSACLNVQAMAYA